MDIVKSKGSNPSLASALPYTYYYYDWISEARPGKAALIARTVPHIGCIWAGVTNISPINAAEPVASAAIPTDFLCYLMF